jgi:hypothetical protein
MNLLSNFVDNVKQNAIENLARAIVSNKMFIEEQRQRLCEELCSPKPAHVIGTMYRAIHTAQHTMDTMKHDFQLIAGKSFEDYMNPPKPLSKPVRKSATKKK